MSRVIRAYNSYFMFKQMFFYDFLNSLIWENFPRFFSLNFFDFLSSGSTGFAPYFLVVRTQTKNFFVCQKSLFKAHEIFITF